MSDISIVRGDTLRLSISGIRTVDGEEYILSDTDVVYLDAKKSAVDKVPIFRKSVTAADYSDGSIHDQIEEIVEYTFSTQALGSFDYQRWSNFAVFRKDYQTYINDILDFSNIREVST